MQGSIKRYKNAILTAKKECDKGEDFEKKEFWSEVVFPDVSFNALLYYTVYYSSMCPCEEVKAGHKTGLRCGECDITVFRSSHLLLVVVGADASILLIPMPHNHRYPTHTH
jgi:hypothetical protein